jgi:L-alanine-DL-glutamate epimerase-like enolase superfamily enzyme
MDSSSVKVNLVRLKMPLAVPHVGAKATRNTTWAILAFVSDAQGRKGIGYSSFRDEEDLEQTLVIAISLANETRGSLAAMLNIERLEEHLHVPSTAQSKSAANALSLAAWDLAAQQRGVACADLWGGLSTRKAIEGYASAFWMDQTPEELIEEAKVYKRANYRLVKMRVGTEIKQSIERILAVRKVFSEPRTIALECGGSWTVPITNQFLREVKDELLWVEDPVDYSEMGQIEHGVINVIGAGEKCRSIDELLDLYSKGGVRNVIIDVQYVGGPIRFLEFAKLFYGLGANVGAHRFSNYSIHLLACLPKSMPIEMLDWTNPAIRPLPDPDSAGKLPVHGPGFQIELDQTVVAKYGTTAL